MPFSLSSFISERWTLEQSVCLFNAYLMIALLGLTFISMTCTAMIRYIRVLRPTLRHFLKPKRTLIVILILWLAYFLLILFPAVLGEFPEGRYNVNRRFCRLRCEGKEPRKITKTVRYMVVILGFPLAVVIFTTYYKLFRFISHHNQIVVPNLQQGISPNIEEVKITKTLVTVAVGFVVCWIPAGIIEVVSVTKHIHSFQFATFVVFLQTIFIFTSSVINPLIYYFTNKRFKREYLRLLCSLLPVQGQIFPG